MKDKRSIFNRTSKGGQKGSLAKDATESAKGADKAATDMGDATKDGLAEVKTSPEQAAEQVPGADKDIEKAAESGQFAEDAPMEAKTNLKQAAEQVPGADKGIEKAAQSGQFAEDAPMEAKTSPKHAAKQQYPGKGGSTKQSFAESDKAAGPSDREAAAQSVENATARAAEGVKKVAAPSLKISPSASKPLSKGFLHVAKSIVQMIPGKGMTAAVVGIATVAAATVLTVNAIRKPDAPSPKSAQNTPLSSALEKDEAIGTMTSDETSVPKDPEAKQDEKANGGSSAETTGTGMTEEDPPIQFHPDAVVRWIFTMQSDSTPADPDCGDGAPYNNWIQFVMTQGSSFTSDPDDPPTVSGQIDASGNVIMQIIITDEENTNDGCGDYTDLEGRMVGNSIEGAYTGHDCSNYCVWSGTFRVSIGE